MPHRNTDRLRGLLTAILTPFDAHGDLALHHVPEIIEFQREAGIDGLVVCGTNGEGTSMSAEERMRTLDAMMERGSGLLMVAGTGAASVTDAVALTQHAARAGADAALVLPPFFFRQASTAGLAAYFHAVLDSADLPIMLYSIPQMTGIAISDELIQSLAGHPNLAGIKDSAGDWERTQQIIQRFPDLHVFAGSDRLAARCYAGGGAGCISGSANAFPEIVAGVRNAYRDGAGGAQTADAQSRLDMVIDITSRFPALTTNKSILPHRGLPRLGVRAPLVNLDTAAEAALIAELRGSGLL